MSQPLSVGDKREVEIVDIGEEGDPLAFTQEGLAIFLDEGEIGDEVTVEIDKMARSVAFGSVIAKNSGESATEDNSTDSNNETPLAEEADHKYDTGDALSDNQLSKLV